MKLRFKPVEHSAQNHLAQTTWRKKDQKDAHNSVWLPRCLFRNITIFRRAWILNTVEFYIGAKLVKLFQAKFFALTVPTVRFNWMGQSDLNERKWRESKRTYLWNRRSRNNCNSTARNCRLFSYSSLCSKSQCKCNCSHPLTKCCNSHLPRTI